MRKLSYCDIILLIRYFRKIYLAIVKQKYKNEGVFYIIIEFIKKAISVYKFCKDYCLKRDSRNIYVLSAKAFKLACKQNFSGYNILHNEKGFKLQKAFFDIYCTLNLKMFDDILNVNRKDDFISEIKRLKILEVETNSRSTAEYDLSAFYNNFYELFRSSLIDEILNNPYAEKRVNLISNINLLKKSEELSLKMDNGTEKIVTKIDKSTEKFIQAIEEKISDEKTEKCRNEKLIAIRSHAKGTEESMQKACYSLDLLKHFTDRIPNNNNVWEKIKDELVEFVSILSNTEAYQMDAAVHYSIAYFLGILLNSKSGKIIKYNQWVATKGIQQWEPISNDIKEYIKFKVEEKIINQTSDTLVVCVSITNDILNDVSEFIKANNIEIEKIVNYKMDNNIGNISVENGQHAWKLAEQIKRDLDGRPLKKRAGNIHFFFAAPAGLVFFLGQMSFSLKNIHLYEFANNTTEPKDIYYKTFFIEKGEI